MAARNISKKEKRSVNHRSMWRSFFGGAASIFHLMPSRPPQAAVISTPKEALAGDWRAVGNDIRGALQKFRAQNSGPL